MLQQPYAGLQKRTIRALSEERVADLLEGRGSGYALAAELNHYPGPKHVLELATELHLSQEQEQVAHDLFTGMDQNAQELGRQLVMLETEMDQSFRLGEMTENTLNHATSQIASIEGQLRMAHLVTHLRMKAVLTTEQVAHYDQLRGYTEDSSFPS